MAADVSEYEFERKPSSASGMPSWHRKLADLNLIVVGHVSHNPALQGSSHSKYVDLQGRSALHHAVDGFGVLLFEAGAAVGTPDMDDNDPISSLSPESFWSLPHRRLFLIYDSCG